MEVTKEELDLLKDFELVNESHDYADYEQYTADISVPNLDDDIGMTLRATKVIEESVWYGTVVINDNCGNVSFEKEIPSASLEAVLCKLEEYKQKYKKREWKFVKREAGRYGYVEMID